MKSQQKFIKNNFFCCCQFEKRNISFQIHCLELNTTLITFIWDLLEFYTLLSSNEIKRFDLQQILFKVTALGLFLKSCMIRHIV